VSIKGRIEHLQARLAGACSECHHKPEVIHVFYPEKGDPKPEPPTCSSCGRSLGVVFRVVYEDEGRGPE
jgi:NAD-dependent SIR2 family protein deacetylase